MQGWIKLHRKIKEHWLYQERREFSRFEAWIDLLLVVNHKDKKFLLGSDLVEVKAGQTITSIRKLCERWGWSNSKVTKFLKLLQNDGMIHLESDTKKTTVTIVKYEVYQSVGNSGTTQNSHPEDKEQIQKHTNKNDKKIKNDKNAKKDIYSAEFEQFWDQYPRKVDKQKAFKSFKAVRRRYSLEAIINGTMKYSKEVVGREIQYIKHPSTFLSNQSFLDGFGERGKYNGKEQAAKRFAEENDLPF